MMPDASIDLRSHNFAKATAWSLPLLAAVATLAIRLLIGTAIVDDAYITFRYVANLSEGVGLVYNVGERVFGSSTPLYVFTLFLANQVDGLALPNTALWLNGLLDAVSAVFIVQLGRRLKLSGALAFLAGLVWALYPISIRYAVGGMEGALVACLILGSFYLFLDRRDLWSVGLAGLAALTRPDALAYSAVLFLMIGWERPKNLIRAGLIYSAVLLPWIIFSTAYFGSPIPQSIIAKSHDVYRTDPSINAVQSLYFLGGLFAAGPLKIFAEGLSYYPKSDLDRLVLAAVFLVVAFFWVRGARRAFRIDKRWLVGFGFIAVFLAVYLLLGLRGSIMAEWYLVQVAPFLVLGVFSGIASLNFSTRSYQKQFAIGLVVVGLQLAGFVWNSSAGSPRLVPAAVWTPRESFYIEVAERLKPAITEGDRIAAPEIGALGYYCGCEILDTVGLVSPKAVNYYPLPEELQVRNNAIPPGLIQDERPEFIVSLDVFLAESLLEDPWFLENYSLLWEQDTGIFGSQALQVYAFQGGETRSE